MKDFKDLDFIDADLNYVDFKGADLKDTNFYGANFKGANFTDADFKRANFNRVNFADADFYRANFTDADFKGAKISAAKIALADIDDIPLLIKLLKEKSKYYNSFVILMRQTENREYYFKGISDSFDNKKNIWAANDLYFARHYKKIEDAQKQLDILLKDYNSKCQIIEVKQIAFKRYEILKKIGDNNNE